MAIRLPKINWEKVGAYTLGGLLGGGLSALAWHMMEKRGIDPAGVFRRRIVNGNKSYYDPEKDPNLADMMDGQNEDDPEDDEEEAVDEGSDSDGINEPRIYQIDREIWYRSEDEDGYKHAEMKYWIDDQRISDEYDKLIPKPWVLIGGDNYDMLSDENSDREMFVRNEELETDYCITRMDGGYEE